ncbi:hypothetical protein, partial [Escherichia coli]|uniref:hypothetical protein n=1 Tax=Escherichia coli TaxID=562 RepID=UPI0022F0F312
AGSAKVCSGESHQVAANATAVANATPAAIHCHRAIVLCCLCLQSEEAPTIDAARAIRHGQTYS